VPQNEILRRAESLGLHADDLLKQGRYSEALQPAQEALAIRQQTLCPMHLLIAESATTLGLAFHYLGQVSEAKKNHELALQIRERVLGAKDPLVAQSLTNLARARVSSGDFQDARLLLNRAIEIQERAGRATHPDTAVTLSYLGMVRGLEMDLPQAIEYESRAVDIFDHAAEARPADHATALNSLGTIIGRTGNFAKARPLIERALHIQEQTLGPAHPSVARTLDSLADLVSKMGSYDDALLLAERALKIREQAYGSSHVEVAASLSTVGRLYWYRQDLGRAAQYFERAIAITEQSVGRQHPVVAANLLDLGEVERQMQNLPRAQKLLQEAVRIQEQTTGGMHPDLATSLTRLAMVHVQMKNLGQAISLLARAVSIREQVLGPLHPDLAVSLNDLARLYHASGDLPKARALYARARSIYLSMGQLNNDLDDATLAVVVKRGIAGLRDYLNLLASMAATSKGSESRTVLTEGFVVAEQARGWMVQAAVAKAVARRQVGSGEEEELARKVEELRRQRQTLRANLAGTYGRPDPSKDGPARNVLQDQLTRVQAELDRGIQQLESSAPRYAAIALPKPVEAAEIRSLLRRGEALVSCYVLEDRVQIWLVKPGQDLIYRETTVPRATLASMVTRLRKSVVPAQSTALLPPVDVDTAADLYRMLLEPVRSFLTDVTSLMIVPDELLLPLPFAVLLTERNSEAHLKLAELSRLGRTIPFDEAGRYPYGELPWLAKSYAISVVPSAGVLKLLRESPRAVDGTTEMFIGFGDPDFEGQGKERGGLQLQTRGGVVDREQLRGLNRLPGTRQEVLAMAAVFGVAPESHVFLDQEAREATVKQLSQSGRLARTRVLAFSTHGLLGGELAGLSQPALALSVPATSSEDEDGLLTLEEILQLRLTGTDLVVLSACNTAAGDGSGEGLSGLARAFFFAGARAMLVSHWSVDDAATQALMTETFTRYARDAQSAAAAIRQGMAALMKKSSDRARPYYGHPYAWAPFFVVGDGGEKS